MPTVSLPAAPTSLAGHLRRNWNAPLPNYSFPQLRQTAYARLLSTPSRLTSELLRTL